MPGGDCIAVLGADDDFVLEHPDAVDLGLEANLGPRGHRGLGQRLDDLAEPSARVVERPTLPVAAAAPHHPGRDLPPGVGRYPSPRLHGADPVTRKTPQLLGVWRVQGLVQRRAESRPQYARVCFVVDPPKRSGRRVADHLGHHGRGKRAEELPTLERKSDPAAGNPQLAVTRSALQVVAEQPTQVGQQRLRRRRMQPVRPVVDAYAGHLERPGQATDPVGSLEQRDLEPALGSAPRGGEPSRAGAEDDEIVRAAHGCDLSLSPAASQPDLPRCRVALNIA
jgi:hypothetical protein